MTRAARELKDWTFRGFSGQFDGHVREQLPWYDMATAAVAMIARHYIPQGGKVYDLGCSTGNIGRVLAPTLHEREARLVLMFLPVPARRRLLATLRGKVEPGGAIIVVDKEESPGGYPATVLSRLTWDCKLRQGAEPGAVMRKELSLSGVQRPLYRGELGPDAVEVFRFGDFAGWLIEA